MRSKGKALAHSLLPLLVLKASPLCTPRILGRSPAAVSTNRKRSEIFGAVPKSSLQALTSGSGSSKSTLQDYLLGLARRSYSWLADETIDISTKPAADLYLILETFSFT